LIAAKARFRNARKLERATGLRIPDYAFQGGFLEVVDGGINFSNLDRGLRDQLKNFITDFLDCRCRQSPFCGCPERKFTLAIIELREQGLDHRQISEHMLDVYGLEVFPADILSFLEDTVHLLEAVRDIAVLEGEDALADDAKEHIKRIEG
jgi:superfamily II helicase